MDAGFEGRHWHTRWAQGYGATLIAKPKRTDTDPGYWPRPLRRWHARIRQIVQTVHDRLLATFGLEHERPQDRAGFRARLAAKVGLHTFCLWLNVQHGRPPLAFADLIDWSHGSHTKRSSVGLPPLNHGAHPRARPGRQGVDMALDARYIIAPLQRTQPISATGGSA